MVWWCKVRSPIPLSVSLMPPMRAVELYSESHLLTSWDFQNKYHPFKFYSNRRGQTKLIFFMHRTVGCAQITTIELRHVFECLYILQEVCYNMEESPCIYTSVSNTNIYLYHSLRCTSTLESFLDKSFCWFKQITRHKRGILLVYLWITWVVLEVNCMISMEIYGESKENNDLREYVPESEATIMNDESL